MLDNADQARFDRLRYVELKHGRIAMLAVLGHVVTSSGLRLPGNIDYSGEEDLCWQHLMTLIVLECPHPRGLTHHSLNIGCVLVVSWFAALWCCVFGLRCLPNQGHKFTDLGVGLKAIGDIPTGGLVQIFSFIFLFESFIMKDQVGPSEPDSCPFMFAA